MSFSVFAQINDLKNGPFVGIWEYQQGSSIFRLIIWENQIPKDDDNKYYLEGHFEMAEINGLVETVLYTSKPVDIINKKMPVAFTGTVDDGVFQGELKIIDEYEHNLSGNFKIAMLPHCSNCQPKISWELYNLHQKNALTHESVSSVAFKVLNGVVLLKQK